MRCDAAACIRSLQPAVHRQHTLHDAARMALYALGRRPLAHTDRHAAVDKPRSRHRRLHLVYMRRLRFHIL